MTGMVIFATTPDDDAGIALAREWIKLMGLTQADATLGRKGGSVVVIAKREVVLNGNG